MRRILLALVLLASPATLAEAPLGYYRFPTIRGDTIVFGAEGDLWKVAASGGVATRLTSHAGEESSPVISPDGTRVAFTGEYEGPAEVYTIPIDGGLPVRRTWHGRAATPVGFAPDGRLMYSTRKFSTLPSAQLVELDLTDGSQRVVPLSQAADGCYAADGRTLIFTRFARQGSHTKRYKGGTAQNLWSFTEGLPEAVPLTADYPGTSSTPLCWQDRVYFISDRDGTMNLWSMRPEGTDLQQLTRHAGWDVKSPSLGDGRIVYQLGADLRLYDLQSAGDRPLEIRLATDLDQMRERWIDAPTKYLTAHHPSPDGDRVALTARGEVFVAPVKAGRLVHVARKPGVRYRQARFLPDGKSLVALSDESGEVEWWRLPADGIGEPRRVTQDGKVLRFFGVPSPDGKWLVHHDHDQELWLTDLGNSESKKIDFSPYWGYGGITWSPDSRYIAYDRSGDNQLERVFVYDVREGTRHAVTSERFESYSPSWSADGKWLYFLSDRTFRSIVGSPWGTYQPQPYFDRPTTIYHVALVKDLRSPFRPADELLDRDDKQSDGDASASKDDEKPGRKKRGKKGAAADKDDDDDSDAPVKVQIDFDGIEERVLEVPVDRGNLGQLWVAEKLLFWIDYGPAGEREPTLKALPIGNAGDKPQTVASDIRSYQPTQDGKRLLLRKGDQLHMIDAAKSKADLDETLIDLKGWAFPLDPREEWRQMFVESWRLERDYFYDRAMHGVDWTAMLQKYLPLVDRVTNRAELSDLQAQMAGELSALHTFVYGGDHREGDDDVDPASLGATLTRDEVAGGHRVDHIYRSDPDLPGDAAPLARAGVDVREGDVILSINGVPTLSVADPAVLLRDQAGKQVRLGVRPAAAGRDGKPRDVIVTPIGPGSEDDLRYDEWEYTRRLRVDERSDSRIGYVHLRAMGSSNINTWYRDFFPVFDRQGLIIDVRHNRGGNIDAWILEKLLRRAWFYWQPRVGKPYWNMHYAFRGHMVLLMNESTASDGEAFAEGFRRLGLGKLIGTRTWGGEIWLTSSNTLVDEGIVTAAEFGVYGPQGDWLIEGHGVEPDIVVDNLPHRTFGGEDAQLDAAIEHLERLIRDDPRPVPPPPAYPDKSRP